MRQLNHRTQPTPDTCGCASLAMVLDMDVNILVDQIHHDYISGELWFDEVLDGMCVEYKYMFPNCNTMRLGKVYIASVPSLNIPDSTHAIVIDARKEFRILDPNKGREGVKFYGEGGTPLTDYTLYVELDGSLYEAA